ncbi:unnamed protein product [Gordionus sp. m RMFG-2023]
MAQPAHSQSISEMNTIDLDSLQLDTRDLESDEDIDTVMKYLDYPNSRLSFHKNISDPSDKSFMNTLKDSIIKTPAGSNKFWNNNVVNRDVTINEPNSKKVSIKILPLVENDVINQETLSKKDSFANSNQTMLGQETYSNNNPKHYLGTSTTKEDIINMFYRLLTMGVKSTANDIKGRIASHKSNLDRISPMEFPSLTHLPVQGIEPKSILMNTMVNEASFKSISEWRIYEENLDLSDRKSFNDKSMSKGDMPAITGKEAEVAKFEKGYFVNGTQPSPLINTPKRARNLFRAKRELWNLGEKADKSIAPYLKIILCPFIFCLPYFWKS